MSDSFISTFMAVTLALLCSNCASNITLILRGQPYPKCIAVTEGK